MTCCGMGVVYILVYSVEGVFQCEGWDICLYAIVKTSLGSF